MLRLGERVCSQVRVHRAHLLKGVVILLGRDLKGLGKGLEPSSVRWRQIWAWICQGLGEFINRTVRVTDLKRKVSQ